MASKTTVTCDNCIEEVHGFWFGLECHETRTQEELCQLVYRIPPINRTHHFCNWDCMMAWMLKNEKITPVEC